MMFGKNHIFEYLLDCIFECIRLIPKNEGKKIVVLLLI